MRVITYRLIYQQGFDACIDLCDSCAADPSVEDRFGALGEVQHGGHDGSCEACDPGRDEVQS